MTTLEATCRYPFVPEMGGGGRTTFDGDALTPPGVSPPFYEGYHFHLNKHAARGTEHIMLIVFQSIPPGGLGQTRFSPSHCAPCPPSHSPTWRLSAILQLLQWAGLSCSASPMRRHMPSILPATLRLRYSGRGILIRRTVDSGCRPIPGIPARISSIVTS